MNGAEAFVGGFLKHASRRDHFYHYPLLYHTSYRSSNMAPQYGTITYNWNKLPLDRPIDRPMAISSPTSLLGEIVPAPKRQSGHYGPIVWSRNTKTIQN